MGNPSETSSSRRLWTGAVLIAAIVASVLLGSGLQKPWTPSAPAYRQKGPANAKVVLVEFADFECPSCGAAVGTIKHLEALYGQDMRIIFKHCPWTRAHQWALSASLAAECAGRQGKFWQMYDKLYENQMEWAPNPKANEVMTSYAESLGLDAAAYDKCLEDGDAMKAIQADMQEVKDRWINSTPTFFINGKRVVGVLQLRTTGISKIERTLGK